MTIASTARKAGPLNGNGTQDEWPFTFKVFAEGDVKVTIADADGVETVLTSNYSVALNANQETSPGGTVTYPVSGDPLPVGSVLSITGDLDYDQPLDLPSGGNFSPLAIENQFDRATMQIQQLREELDRAARLPVTSDEDAEALVADLIRLADSADNIDTVAGAIDNVNTVAANVADVNTVAANIGAVAATGANIAAVVAVGNDLLEPTSEINTVATDIANVNTVATGIANVNTVAGIAADVATVAGVAADVSTVADNVVDITNFADIYQGPHATDPTLRNNGGALQSGDLYFNTTENALRAYSGTVWVAGTAGSVSVQSFSGDGIETVFTLTTAPTSENNTQIYIGGAYQQKSQYGISGTALTFTEAPPVGTDNIEVVTLSSLALGVTDAALVAFTPTGGLASTNVQAALTELDSEKQAAMTAASQAEMEAGAETALRSMSPLRVKQAVTEIQPISASVAANALTISAPALSLEFRSTTLGSGAVTRVGGTPADLVISAGSTLGTVNAVQSDIVVLALNNAGTIELAAVNIAGGNDLSETGLVSTTAEGGAGAADSASVIYSATARTNVAYRVLGVIRSTQATAGTWATAPSLIQGVGGQALAAMSSLGYGQTWQDVGASRVSGTTYYNTTGKPIALKMEQSVSAGTFSITVGGVQVGFLVTSASSNGECSAIVPPGVGYSYSYSVGIGIRELR